MSIPNLHQKIGTLLAVKQRVAIDTKFLTSSIESRLCDYSDADVLVKGNINVVEANYNTKMAFKNCAPFRKCRTDINKTFWAEHINTAMPMYNFIE